MKRALFIAFILSAHQLQSMELQEQLPATAHKIKQTKSCCVLIKQCCYLGAICYMMASRSVLAFPACIICCPDPISQPSSHPQTSLYSDVCCPDPSLRPFTNTPDNLAILPDKSKVKQHCVGELSIHGINMYEYRKCDSIESCSDAWYSCLDLSKALYCLRMYNPCNKATATSYTDYFCHDQYNKPRKLYRAFIQDHLTLSSQETDEEKKIINTLTYNMKKKCD